MVNSPVRAFIPGFEGFQPFGPAANGISTVVSQAGNICSAEGTASMVKARSNQLADAVICDALASHGEKFLSLFDGQTERVEQQTSAQAAIAPQEEAGAESNSDSGTASQRSSGTTSTSGNTSDAVQEFVFDNKCVTSRRTGSGVHKQQQLGDLRTSGTKSERRRFMSAKGGDVHKTAADRAKSRTSPTVREDGVPTRQEFLQMQREVQSYGASALDKRSKKKFNAGVLAQLGARAERAPRVAASIGKGMAKKQSEREVRAVEEAIAAGMLSRKGLGKQKKRAAAEQRKKGDRGLMEDGGTFRKGMLRVAPPGAKDKGSRKGSLKSALAGMN